MSNSKNGIVQSLKGFRSGSLCENATALFNSLGYKSDRVMEMENTPDAFIEQFDTRDRKLNREKALFDCWETMDFLFQLTDAEVQQAAAQGSFDFDSGTAYDGKNYQSYLFFALDLKKGHYTRTQLSEITREVNRLFDMPAMILFRLDGELTLTLAIANRRLNKRDTDKDVIQKVTLIKDIRAANPHRAHIDILYDLSLEHIVNEHAPQNFAQLHDAWQKTLDVDALNKKFYRELSNWYFWATQHVHFPHDSAEADKGDLFKDPEKVKEHDAKNLIRLLTRLLFVWFIKEKGLVPDLLFNPKKLKQDVLKDFDAQSKDTRFYKAVLQNLFFATLNQTSGKREFRKVGRQHRNVTTLMRYERCFQDSGSFVELLESTVPFMNGGLFECLDKVHPEKKGPQGGDVILYEDGFSDREDNVLKVPDFLFFAEKDTIDLSDVYGDKKRKKETVRGLIPILESYKFTIVENTPIEEEIALDPELLGKVFENLLASYNPETKTTARKQTGSFYTPRTIVDYMVDESLKAYLQKALCEAELMSEDDAKEGLEILFAYTEKEHAFSDAEKDALIAAIDNCKILDPACGSGAFPMGILHKLEFVLGKLDPQNRLWRDRQLEKVDATIAAAENIDDSTVRENTLRELDAQKTDVEEAFSSNELGYGRKLYLIENCIYGIDIQSIATQVSKLRFFISLIVDQKVNAEKTNFGIRPLPNLETKFATANTLIHVEKPANQGELFENPKVQALEKELKKVRHELFGAKTPQTKRDKRKRDKELREQIATELVSNGWSNASARQLAGWDPYDQNASSSFFDPEWMFDLKGFDIVIGNPPYIQIQKFSKAQKDKWITQKFQTYTATADIYCLFYERGIRLLNQAGHLCFITSNKFFRAGYGKALRKYLNQENDIQILIDFGELPVFEAGTDPCIILAGNQPSESGSIRAATVKEVEGIRNLPETMASTGFDLDSSNLSDTGWSLDGPEKMHLLDKLRETGTPLGEYVDGRFYYGIKTGFNEAFVIDRETRDILIAEDENSADLIKPWLRGKDIKRWYADFNELYVINIYSSANATWPWSGQSDSKAEATFKKAYPAIYKHLKPHTERLIARDDQGQYYWEMRSCAYNAEFDLPKLVYNETSKELHAFYDQEALCINKTGFIIVTDEPEYILGILNSLLMDYFYRSEFPAWGDPWNGGRVQFRGDRMQKISIASATASQKDEIVKRVEEILVLKHDDPAADVSTLEAEIDELIYKLYDLTPEEIAIVEGAT
ncbi:Eco57I restriction-modification methylase domain-containing protein [Pontiellaceae bacterium B12227]|nr:Eco57I restriction-modification methylase domain-containing protein [Pontiellaceae bacterium B12227]